MTLPLIIPKPLKKGDTLAVIAPAGQLADPGGINTGLRILHDMGFETKLPRSLWPGQGYLADSDLNRAKEFHEMIADPEVNGLVALRGGFGCLRMIEYVDYALVRNNPKILIGFSDITVLLSQIVERAGVLCFHGPVVTSLGTADKQTLEKMYRSITGEWQNWSSPGQLEILLGRGKNVTGKLMGGNLSSLVTLLGTKFDFSWENKIIFFEDLHEPLYKIDRMLTQLHLAGKFDQVSGLLLGDFTFDRHHEPLEKLKFKEYVWTRFCELIGQRPIPVWGNFPLGHCPENLTVPIGCDVTLDCNTGKLVIPGC